MMVAEPNPHPPMKDSGVDWLGDVPRHWEIRRLKSLCSPCGLYGANIPAASYGLQGVRFLRTTDITDDGFLTGVGVFVREGSVEEYLLEDGDVLISRSGTVGRSFLYRRRVHGPCAYAGYLVRFAPGPQILPDYLFLFTKSAAFLHFVRVVAISSTIENVNAEKYANCPLPRPPLSEQTAIVRFLDHADRRIQRYIRAKKRLIELLEEQKQAIIHQAVTGQIDVRTGQPYPAYQASGVEWLGDIPAHWERCRLRNVVSEVTTGSRGWSRYAADTGPLFVRVANLSRDSLEMRFDDIVRLDLPSTSETARTRIKEEDLLLSVTAYIGSVAVAPVGFEEAYVSQHVARCEPRSEICSRWLGYVLLSRLGRVHGQMSLYGGTKDGLSLDDVKNYPIVVPPRDEQDRLVRWIECEVSLLGELRDQAQRQIALLREYRTRLIADVVTGKLDVREAAARLLDAGAFAGGSRGGTIHTESTLRASKGDTVKEAAE